jgi:hypothetical protein
MAKKKNMHISQMFTEVKGERLAAELIIEKFSADVVALVNICTLYRGKFIEPFKINSYMLINNFNKFLNTQIEILNAYPEDHFLSQSAITRLNFFSNYITNKNTKS